MLPVVVDGAYLYLGDVHACQADGEFYGSADEARATLTLSCEIISQKRIPWVRVETPNSIIQLNCSKPLEETVKQAFLWMIDWLVEDYGFTSRDAYVQLELNPDVRINVYQMVALKRLNYTAGVSFPKHALSEG
jgi:acetamidase/formamidase